MKSPDSHTLMQVWSENQKILSGNGALDAETLEDMGHPPIERLDEVIDAGRERAMDDEMAEIATMSQPVQPQRRPFEIPGRNRNGRSNTSGLPRPVDVQKGLTDAEIDRRAAINHAGAAAVRAAHPQLFDKD